LSRFQLHNLGLNIPTKKLYSQNMISTCVSNFIETLFYRIKNIVLEPYQKS
jgi:hypothetical protein